MIDRLHFRRTHKISRVLLIVLVIFGLINFYLVGFQFEKRDILPYTLFFTFTLFQTFYLLTLIHTIWPRKPNTTFDKSYTPSVDIYITVAGEPIEIVSKTVEACLRIKYQGKFSVFVLNDGFVCGSDNWKEIDDLSNKYNIQVITRKLGGGAKAGNINHAMTKTNGELIAVFDADHIPFDDFLQETVPFLHDPKMAFVQSPQYYVNNQTNLVSKGSFEQQDIFFGPIMIGKSNLNSAFMCGTNLTLRRKALLQVGGMNEKSIAEDFMTSFDLHKQGWKSYYNPKILAMGLAPEDLFSFCKQQFRWARGSLQMFFENNILFSSLNINQKISYLTSTLYYFNGLVLLINYTMPILFFYFGLSPLNLNSLDSGIVFFPLMLITFFVVHLSTPNGLSFHSIGFNNGLFTVFLKAFYSTLFRLDNKFVVTSKASGGGFYPSLIYPHLAFILLCVIGAIFSISRNGVTSNLIHNLTWTMMNIFLLLPFIATAMPQKFAKYISASIDHKPTTNSTNINI
jgi:cellulose synthase (UDP-forming)